MQAICGTCSRQRRGIVGSLQDLTLEQYQADENLRLATERRIEIIGEAAGRVS